MVAPDVTSHWLDLNSIFNLQSLGSRWLAQRIIRFSGCEAEPADEAGNGNISWASQEHSQDMIRRHWYVRRNGKRINARLYTRRERHQRVAPNSHGGKRANRSRCSGFS
jgi:hypothetical protein